MHNFLEDRTQQVSAEGSKSSRARVKSGVPQGSVLGPLLFLIMLYDIDKDTDNSEIMSFADDSRILSGIETMEDHDLLQADLNLIINWAEKNNMEFNSEKFVTLHYGRNNDLKNIPYLSEKGMINRKNSVKDLGVTMSYTADFKEHIHSIVKRARRMAGWVLRTFKTRKAKPLLILFKSLVLPILEYASQLWAPADNNYSLQRRRQRYIIIYYWK